MFFFFYVYGKLFIQSRTFQVRSESFPSVSLFFKAGFKLLDVIFNSEL